MKGFLLIEGCNFKDCPSGGQLNFANQLTSIYKEEIILAGITTDKNVIIGKWTTKSFNGHKTPFFPFRYRTCGAKKAIIPERLKDFLAIRKYKKEILSKKIKNVFIQSPELLIITSNWGWKNICYSFPGVENPLEMPRYKWGKMFAKTFDRALFNALKKVDIVLARADKKSIKNMIERSNGIIDSNKVFHFPTRVDTDVFYSRNQQEIKDSLQINSSYPILVNCGRINKVKGWEFILESFEEVLFSFPSAVLYYVGDGEDKSALEKMISTKNLKESVVITGFQTQIEVVKWLNLADLVLVGSHREGWATIMLEAIACGKPIVSTDVSGARDMIKNGENGFVVQSRNSKEFASAIRQSLKLKNVKEISLAISSKYALSTLKEDLDILWLRKK